ncbi:S2-RNase [Pyrus ussuriensis x Pyrus communis]|uniref:S2-RNase n=1 Tax=Pyrus ussuriensis x Pyrus communis TaxID=2448454 RepID=A0A5N5EZ29_9ROSA|nr:S2-RNase [Pyrus ussuriensis x Pyrus communis]
MVNQGGYWVGFVEGNESFKMVVVASKKSTGVGRNRPWKMDPRQICKSGLGESISWSLSLSLP